MLVVQRGNPAVMVVELDIVSFDANGFTVDPIIASAADIAVNYFAVGGSQITAETVSLIQPAAKRDLESTALTFQPDFLLAVLSHSPTLDSLAGAYKFNIGFTDGVNAALYGSFAGENEATSATQTYVRAAAAQKDIVAAQVVGGVSQRDSFLGFLTKGFNLTVTEYSGTLPYVFFLAIRGGRWRVGPFTAPATTGNFDVTGSDAWTPQGLFAVLGRGTAQSTVDTPDTTGTQFSIGSAISSTSRVSAGAAGNTADAANASYANTSSATRLWSVMDGDGSTLLTDGDFVSFLTGGWRANVVSASATHRFGIYFTVAPNAPLTSPVPVGKFTGKVAP